MEIKARKSAHFPPTDWSAVRRVAAGDAVASARALDRLLANYYPVLRSYLLDVRRVPPDQVDDDLHAFLADRVLAGRLLQRADPARGRLRNLLLKALNNYLHTLHAKRVRSPLAFADPNDLPELPVPDRMLEAFEWTWVRHVLEQALEAMRLECIQRSREDVWGVFACRVVQPVLNGEPELPYSELVARFRLASPRDAINLLVTAKRMFNRNLRREVARFVPSPEDVDAELRDIRRVLAGPAQPTPLRMETPAGSEHRP